MQHTREMCVSHLMRAPCQWCTADQGRSPAVSCTWSGSETVIRRVTHRQQVVLAWCIVSYLTASHPHLSGAPAAAMNWPCQPALRSALAFDASTLHAVEDSS